MISLFRAFVVYIIKPGKFTYEPSLPWSIKKAQMTALREKAASKSQGFEGLRYCPVLHEYFELN